MDWRKFQYTRTCAHLIISLVLTATAQQALDDAAFGRVEAIPHSKHLEGPGSRMRAQVTAGLHDALSYRLQKPKEKKVFSSRSMCLEQEVTRLSYLKWLIRHH